MCHSLNQRVSVLDETEVEIALHENDNVREATLFQKGNQDIDR